MWYILDGIFFDEMSIRRSARMRRYTLNIGNPGAAYWAFSRLNARMKTRAFQRSSFLRGATSPDLSQTRSWSRTAPAAMNLSVAPFILCARGLAALRNYSGPRHDLG
jgi:P pilus assembly chaperone PapD